MIEVVSHPLDLTEWQPHKLKLEDSLEPENQQESLTAEQKQEEQKPKAFYLELYGETNPVVDMNYAEVLSGGQGTDPAQTTPSGPIYEYWWTIGHAGFSEHTGHLWNWHGANDHDEFWRNLQDDTAAHVYMFFPVNAGWRIKELVATVKYLTPIAEQTDLMQKASEEWQHISPIMAAAGQVTGALAAPLALLPPVGAAATGASALMSAISKVGVNSVPRVDGFNWSTRKVTFPSSRGVMQGVMWQLPGEMMKVLGGRLTGSIALSFIPARVQKAETSQQGSHEFMTAPILAHAAVYSNHPRKNAQIWVPGKRNFIKLNITPIARRPDTSIESNNAVPPING